MDLSYLNSGTPSAKPNLNPVVNILTAGDLVTVQIPKQEATQFSQTNIFNSIIEQSIALSSEPYPFTIPESKNPGGAINIKIAYAVIGNGTDTYTLRFKVNNTTTMTITNTSPVSLTAGVLEIIMNIGGDFLNICLKNDLNGTLTQIPPLNRISYDFTSINSMDITCQWSGTSGNFATHQITMNTVQI